MEAKTLKTMDFQIADGTVTGFIFEGEDGEVLTTFKGFDIYHAYTTDEIFAVTRMFDELQFEARRLELHRQGEITE